MHFRCSNTIFLKGNEHILGLCLIHFFSFYRIKFRSVKEAFRIIEMLFRYIRTVITFRVIEAFRFIEATLRVFFRNGILFNKNKISRNHLQYFVISHPKKIVYRTNEALKHQNSTEKNVSKLRSDESI